VVTKATEQVIETLRQRAAKIWKIDAEAVVWENGEARPAGSNAGDFAPLSLAELAANAGATGGPIAGRSSLTTEGAGPGFGTHICDVEVDPDTGKVQDVGRAIHPSYVEGQLQGGVAQGIGWALNEECIYDAKGHLDNPSFLDYRMPVASDLPMIEPILVEVPNDKHPQGIRGVGEVPLVPTPAAVANAVRNAIGRRMTELPMSPPKVLAALSGGT
jgi:CO/xanthine dehydrogenase Mo-binding subunit